MSGSRSVNPCKEACGRDQDGYARDRQQRLQGQTVPAHAQDRVRGKREQHADTIDGERIFTALNERAQEAGLQYPQIAWKKPPAQQCKSQEMDQPQKVQITLLDRINQIRDCCRHISLERMKLPAQRDEQTKR